MCFAMNREIFTENFTQLAIINCFHNLLKYSRVRGEQVKLKVNKTRF